MSSVTSRLNYANHSLAFSFMPPLPMCQSWLHWFTPFTAQRASPPEPLLPLFLTAHLSNVKKICKEGSYLHSATLKQWYVKLHIPYICSGHNPNCRESCLVYHIHLNLASNFAAGLGKHHHQNSLLLCWTVLVLANPPSKNLAVQRRRLESQTNGTPFFWPDFVVVFLFVRACVTKACGNCCSVACLCWLFNVHELVTPAICKVEMCSRMMDGIEVVCNHDLVKSGILASAS